MNSALFARTNGVFQYPYDGTTDFTAQTGLLVTYSAGKLVVNTSATVPCVAICLDGGGGANGVPATMCVLGAATPPVRMLAKGTIGLNQRVQQDATGGVVADAGAGNQRVVVGVALEAAAAGQYIVVAPLPPTPLNTW